MRLTFRASTRRLAAMTLAMLASTAASAQTGLFDPLAPKAPAQTEKPAVIRPLPAPGGELVLRGEYDRMNLPVYLTSWESANARSLKVRIAERAVSSLPEAAALTILINGQPVTSLRGGDVGVGRDIDIPLTPGLLTTGFNAVTFLAENQHRVDCSAEGTYELWTRLDPAATGLAFTSQPVLEDGMASLPSVLQRSGDVGSFRLVLSAGTDAATAGSLVQAVQAVALAGWAWKPEVTVVSAPTERPGTEVRLISAAEAAQMRSRGGAEISRGVWIVPSSTVPNRLDLAFVASSASGLKDLAVRLAREAEQRPTDGTAAGLIALGENLIRPVADGTSMTLADLGYKSATFTGRRFSDDVRVTMPPTSSPPATAR